MALYAPAFQGIRRSGERTVTLDRGGWRRDRQRMFTRPMGVRADFVKDTRQRDTVEVAFVQRWSSGDYADRGIKKMSLERRAIAT